MSTSIIRLTCPNCQTALGLKTLPAGGRCKCPKCGTIFATGADALPEVKPVAPKVAPVVQKAPAPKAPAPKAPPTRALRASPGVEVLPDRPAKKGNGLMWLLLGGGGVVVAGFFALLLLGGIIGLVVWRHSKSSSDKDGPQAAAKELTPPPKSQPDAQLQPQQPQKNPPQDQPINPQPANNPGDGTLSADVLQRTKQATVYIKVLTNEGRVTGSGFFEESSGLVITNAHVVGMLKSKEPPKQIEVVLNSGTPNETTVAAKLFGVDSNSDLALLDVPLAPQQAASQSKLTVLPAKDLLETQHVYVFGFPFGERVNKAVTVSPSAVTSLHHGDDGLLSKVQVNGGMQPGNSGGPVVDSKGRVVGVAVSIIEGTNLNFAIPGEQVQALLKGRMTDYIVSTNAQPMPDGKYQIAVTIRTLDPCKQITNVALDYWIAPSSQPAPQPSAQRPNVGNRQTVPLAYDTAKREAKGTVVLDSVPDGGNRLWLQAVVTNGTGQPAWQKGFAFVIDPPVDPKPALVKAQYRLGAQPVQLTSTAKYRLKPRGGEERSLLMNIVTRLNENTKALPPAGGAQVRLNVQKFEIGLSLDNEKVDTTDEFQQAIRKDVGQMVLDHEIDGSGNLTSKKVDYLKPVVASSKEILNDIGKQINSSFDLVATPQPGNTMQPGQTWQAKRELPAPIIGDTKPLVMDVTYTFRGVRQHNGHQVAVIELRGDAKDATQSGGMRGTVLIDPTTGMVLQAKAIAETKQIVILRQGRGRLSSYEAIGTLEIKLQRGPGIN